jgi:mono/diheme cytochrome c family protein
MRLFGLLLAAFVLLGCQGAWGETEALPAVTPDPRGDSGRGLTLMQRFECSRCHDIAGVTEPLPEKDCVGCHQDILSLPKYPAPADVLPKWREAVRPLAVTPNFPESASYFKRSWIEKFLLEPRDIRPNLHPMMPRLAISAEEARDIATALAPADEEPISWKGTDLARGRRLIEQKGCGSCHVFSGVHPLPDTPPALSAENVPPSTIALAPDLRFARDRLHVKGLLAWLRNPDSVKPGALMPSMKLSMREARDIARYIMTAELAPEPAPKLGQRLPLLDRRVTYEEVSEKVFRKTCWHCHSEPDYGIGDGGPGNTGGFGFKPRGLSLADYEGIASGYVDDKGERHSVFTLTKEGMPRLVSSLIARRDEMAGYSSPSIRGMPLGLPPLAPEEIQLVESWIAQGRPE